MNISVEMEGNTSLNNNCLFTPLLELIVNYGPKHLTTSLSSFYLAC
jgi:hypothetical protein